METTAGTEIDPSLLTLVQIYFHIYMYIYIRVCVCVTCLMYVCTYYLLAATRLNAQRGSVHDATFRVGKTGV